MAIDKRISYDVQGGVKNYLGKQKEVTAPVKWKSSPDHPETELAYITKAEKDLLVKKDLHGSLKGGVNRGPSGIMSLDGYGSFDGPDTSKDTGMSGTATSAAETGGGNALDIKDIQAQMGTGNLGPGVMPQGAKDYQLAAIASGAGKRVNPGFFDSKFVVNTNVVSQAKAFAPAAFKKTQGGGLMNLITGGGFLGNIIRSIGQKFGLGKKYNQPTYDMSGLSGLPFGGTAAFENLDIRDKFNRTDDGEDEEYDTQIFNFDPTGFNTKNQDLYMTDALTTPTMGQYGLNLMQLNTLKNAGYSNSQIEEAVERGYADELVRDIEGPIGIV